MSADPRSGLGSARCISPEKMRQIRCSEAVALGCCLILAFLPRQAKPGVPGTPRSAPGRGLVRAARVKVCGAACCKGWASGPQAGRCTKPLCIPRCRNGGFCQRPQTCACKPGFEGRRCETEISLQHRSNITVPSARPLEVVSTSSSLKGGRGREGRKAVISRYIGRKKATVRRQPLSVKQSQAMLLRKLSSKLPVAAKSHSPMHIAEGQGSKTIPRMAGYGHSAVKQSKLRVLCTFRCQNGGVCVGRDRCRCTPGFKGRACQIPASSHSSFPTEEPVAVSKSRIRSSYTLPLSNQRLRHPADQRMLSVVNLQVDHPPEVSVKIHQVSRVNGGRNNSSAPQPIVHGTRQRALRDQAMEDQLGSLTVIPQSGGDYPFGYCFTEITNGQCASPLTGLRTLEHCCRGGGVGWGVTECSECPVSPESDCPQGFQKTADGECQDINECSSPRICQNGKCMNMRGSYSCVCNPGYVQDTSKSRCISQQVISPTRGPCYRIWRSGFCSLPVVQNITKQICCCSRVGKAWGPNCQRCPSLGTGAFREVCPAGPGYHYTRSDLRYINRVNEEHSQNRGRVNLVRQTTTLAPRGRHTVAPRLREMTTIAILPTTTTTALPWRRTPAPQLHICLRVPQVCGPGRCMMRQQGYTCVCNAGFRLNAERSRCVDMDECGQRPSPCPNGRCENVVGSYRCVCSRGFVANSQGTDCTDVDECGQRPSPCPNGRCENVVGSYRCVCSRGFVANSQGTDCTDVDECGQRPSPCPNGRCENVVGSYRCVCSRGFVANSQGTDCADVDECGQRPSPCPNGRCENMVGSYRCVCSRGFVANSQGTDCADVDECGQRPSPCPNGRCENVVGSYRCVCSRGFLANSQGTDCADMDECGQRPSPCPNGRCENMVGSYRCVCSRGFVVNSQGTACTDMDECGQRPSPCPNGRCENVVGSYRCVCSRGFVANSQGTDCTDIDECLNELVCPNSECVNSIGSFHCLPCPTGYQIRDRKCTDVDECGQRPSPCPNGRCENVVGSYRCVCSRGFVANSQGTDCTDINECLNELTCPNSECVNSIGSFHCLPCPTGYQIQDQKCTDVDECGQRPSPCPNGRCENVVGSYRCVCSRGFVANSQGTDCTDIDECLNELVCPNSECVNSIGSFHCLPCPTGYQIRDRKCTDIDECARGATCGEAGMCVNTEGSYRCRCNPGYRLRADGNQCADINECFEGDYCAPYGECLNSAGSYTCLCAEGFTTSADLSTCLDVDECTTADRCDRGRCTNTVGSFECSCEPGFRVDADRSQCLDLDECVEYPTICGSKRCENTPGSFQCITECGVGFQLSPAQQCVDIDECSNATICGPNAYCQNVAATFRCHCDQGYQRASDGSQCVDIDECSNATICGPNAYCQNVAASFRCHCDQGYQRASDGSQCVDVNECQIMQGVCGAASCENVPGSFLCICLDEKEEFDPVTGRCNRRVEHATPAREKNECYYNLNDVQLCQNILAGNVTRQECCCTVGEGWGKDCRIYQCPVYDSDEYQSLCPQGRGFISVPHPTFERSYMDADECTLFGSEVCKNGVCVNTVPGYSCYCPFGYYYHSTLLECIDNNECEDADVCDNGECVNTVGSYYCSCQPPLILDVTLRRCTSNDTEQFDVHMALCWQEVGRNYLCKRPFLERLTTYTECCCQYGEAWGMDCALCPTRNTEYHNALCSYLSSPTDEDDGYPYGLEYENYGPQFEPEFPPDTFRTYDPQEYDAGPSPLSDRRGSSPLEFEPYPAADPLGGRTLYESRRQRSGPARSEQSSSSRSRYRPRTRHTGRGFSTRSIRVSLPEQQNRQPDAAPDTHPRLISNNGQYHTQFQQYNSLRVEECGIVNGCENGRCIRVPEGFTCDCDAGYRLDMTKMTCIDINECDEVEDPTVLCRNAKCINTDGSYRCICLRGYVLSRQPNHCTTVQGSVRGAGL
ncbi:latent-transforming growth factor beta-binding protein 4-like isoform X3 [Hypanus sabinus]|uniref:latent-transforming growth factor beta-binding protein 4-like isoform X3 n=1 Tax=Hypanus sabinus TaxID=79690 RepID=UPI0028C431E6|nr:latent-transforming growth factor beta-binding protein 4-like isoform X3 [Hypanus sabinus]